MFWHCNTECCQPQTSPKYHKTKSVSPSYMTSYVLNKFTILCWAVLSWATYSLLARSGTLSLAVTYWTARSPPVTACLGFSVLAMSAYRMALLISPHSFKPMLHCRSPDLAYSCPCSFPFHLLRAWGELCCMHTLGMGTTLGRHQSCRKHSLQIQRFCALPSLRLCSSWLATENVPISSTLSSSSQFLSVNSFSRTLFAIFVNLDCRRRSRWSSGVAVSRAEAAVASSGRFRCGLRDQQNSGALSSVCLWVCVSLSPTLRTIRDICSAWSCYRTVKRAVIL